MVDELIVRLVAEGVSARLVADVAMAIARAEAAEAMVDGRRARDRARKRRNSADDADAAERLLDPVPATASAEPAEYAEAAPSLPSPRTPQPTHPRDSSRPRGATALPADFSLPADWAEWARAERGWSETEVAAEAASFADYWHAKAGRDARKRDWQATWRVWVRNSRRPGGRQQAAARTRKPDPFDDALLALWKRYQAGEMDQSEWMA